MSDRWAKTDSLLREYDKRFKVIYSNIKDRLYELFRVLNFERDSLNRLDSSLERKLKREIKNYDDPYLDYLVSSYRTNQDLMGIFIYLVYLDYLEEQFRLSQEVLIGVANDIYDQGKEEETPLSSYPETLGWDEIEEWAVIPTVNLPYYDYLKMLVRTDSEEAYKSFIAAILQGTILDLEKLLEKQKNRMISVNEDRFSGILEYASELVGNEAYVEPFPESEFLFVAVMDKRTTRMCESLHGQKFKSLSDNRFTRYSAAYGGMHEFYCKGLVTGLNRPPITDHFHYCRSHLVRI